MLCLKRLMEHLLTAVCGLRNTRITRSTYKTVAGVMCAIGDAIMRRRAVDLPSEACSHLLGQTRDGAQLGLWGFGLSTSFARQSAFYEPYDPRVAVARTAVLDYFQSPEQGRLEKIFVWERSMKVSRGLARYLRNVSREVGHGFYKVNSILADDLPHHSSLLRNFPELVAYRDIAYTWKVLLNPDFQAALEGSGFSGIPPAIHGQLVWSEGDVANTLTVKCNIMNPLPATPRMDHAHRSVMDPARYVKDAETEEDILYAPVLPDFNNTSANKAIDPSLDTTVPVRLESKADHSLSQRDAELLLTSMTVPYLRLPLILTFFSTGDRVHKLVSKKLCRILEAATFENGRHLPVALVNVKPTVVPTQKEELLATSYGALLNELCRAPHTVFRALESLLKSSLALDTGSPTNIDPETWYEADTFNSHTQIILFISRIAARVENYATFLVDHVTGDSVSINAPLREVGLPEGRAACSGTA